MESDISTIINECLNNPILKSKLIVIPGLSYSEKKHIDDEICRMFGYCILFKSNEDIEQYMSITEKNEQIQFLKEKIAKKIGISTKEISNKMDEIIKYAFESFKVNGYVFHGCNSDSAESKMKLGLKGSSNEHIKELMDISYTFKKYGFSNLLLFADQDAKNNRTGWFYDATPRNLTYYSDSPEWFNQLCGEAIAYNGLIPDECRHGYRNRDYDTAFEAINILISHYRMNDEDKNKIIEFFNKSWNKFKNTKPCAILVPISEIQSKDAIQKNLNFYLKEFDPDFIFEDIISCEVVPMSIGVNQHESTRIPPEILSCIDLSPILPRSKRESPIETVEKTTLLDCINILKGFDLENLQEAKKLINALEEREEITHGK